MEGSSVTMTTSPMADETVASQQIAAAGERLGQAIQEQGRLLDGLVTRLAPVLLPEFAVADEGKTVVSGPQQSPLAGEIDRHADGIVDFNERVAALLRRLDV